MAGKNGRGSSWQGKRVWLAGGGKEGLIGSRDSGKRSVWQGKKSWLAETG